MPINDNMKNSDKEYALKFQEDSTHPWTVLSKSKNSDYWQQASPWYFNKGNAVKKLNELRNK